jgi:hypothetical protein
VIARRVLEDERIQPLFEREWYKDGTQKYSSDYVFSRKARAKGWEILCSWDHLCHHFKTADFLELIQIYGAPDDLYGIRLLDKETGEFEPAPSIAIAAKEEVASA